MNLTLIVPLTTASLLVAGIAFGQSPPPDAGAAADESFAPGPGGGERDAGSGRPPLESTGLEDAVSGGCGCRVAGPAAPSDFGLVALGLAAGAAVGRRRARSRR